MISKLLTALLFLTATVWGQAPVITSFVNMSTLDSNFGPGSELVVFGTFTTPAAGRDFTIQVGLTNGGINAAVDGVFILATVPPNTPPGQQMLVITYQGAASNALPINIAPLAPEINNYGVSWADPESPPIFAPFRSFQHTSNGNSVTPTSPASRNEVLLLLLTGIGENIAPQVTPVVTVAGLKATILQTNPNPGYEQIYFAVPANAPLGIDPVVVTVAGAASETVNLPVGTAPAIGGVLNGASFGSPGVVAPGSIVSVFGAGFGGQDNLASFPLTAVNGASVQFGKTAAPIFALAASSGQINALVPMEAPTGQMNVTVQAAAGTSAAFSVMVATAAPGMFYLTDPLLLSRHTAIAVTANTAWFSMPLSQAASLKIPTGCAALAATQVCAQPAHPGDTVQLFVTGLGLATPDGDPNGTPLPTGSVAPAGGTPLYVTLLTPTVTIGGQPATVLFSGMAPGYSGLYQVDVQIPPDAPAGDDVPIQIKSGGISDSATIALTTN